MFWVLAFCHEPMYIYLSTLQSMKTDVIVMHPLMQHYSFFFNKKITT